MSSAVREGPAALRRGQRGQAFIAMLALLAALSLAFVAVFDTGQMMLAKLRLASATDAAAYSAAVWDARSLNFAAAMNRAVVANEAGLAQSVSLRSWSAYMNRTLSNVGAVTRWLPYLNAATDVLRRFWQGFDRGLQPSLVAAESVFSTAIPLLAGAQEVMLQSSEAGALSIIRETLVANDPEAEITAGGQLLLLSAAAQARGFTAEYSGPRRARQREVVLGSLDGFVRQRNVRLAPPLAAPVVRFEKRGGTELLGFEQWRAVDTLSLHARSGVLLGRWRERVPVGWGAAANGRSSVARGSFGATARVNPRATRLANAGLRELRSYRGLPALSDLSPRALQPERPSRRWVIRTARRVGSLRTSATALRVARSPASSVDRLFSMAAAEVRFERRIARADGRLERGSLYNPYWRAPVGGDGGRAHLCGRGRRCDGSARFGGAVSAHRRACGPLALRRRCAGQALVECLVVCLALVPLWFAVQRVARWQDVQSDLVQQARQVAFAAALSPARPEAIPAGRDFALPLQAAAAIADYHRDPSSELAIRSAGDGLRHVLTRGSAPGLAGVAQSAARALIQPVEAISPGRTSWGSDGWMEARVELDVALTVELPAVPVARRRWSESLRLLIDDGSLPGPRAVAARTDTLLPQTPLDLAHRAIAPLRPVVALMEPAVRGLCARRNDPEQVPADRLRAVRSAADGQIIGNWRPPC